VGCHCGGKQPRHDEEDLLVATTMMALRAHARGGPEQLVYEQAPVPEPGPGEVLVAVHAAGITFAEFSWDESWTTSEGADRTPVIPAHEVSGVVAGIGAEVGTWPRGTRSSA
jgi:NADPH:quinone reductase-like Zn-dependent oxidoreductase